MALEAAVGSWVSSWWASDMSTSESGFVCSVGPAIEWLEPKIPDILKNGGTLPSITKEDGKTEALERLEMDSCDIAGVRYSFHQVYVVEYLSSFVSIQTVFLM